VFEIGSTPWLWLGLTSLLIAAGAFVLYGGADYPGVFADSPGAVEGGPERDAAIEAWHDRYFAVGLPFAIAAATTTVAWMVALRQRWLLFGAVAAAVLLVLAPFVEQAIPLLVVSSCRPSSCCSFRGRRWPRGWWPLALRRSP
jgi:hypothetical protein